MWQYGLSFIAGILTTLSPCVLPALPLIIGSALQEHKYGPMAVAGGMIASFTVLGITLTSVESILGLDPSAVRITAAAFLVVSGLVLLSKALQNRVSLIGSPLAQAANRILAKPYFSGFKGQFFLGTLLGAVWSPCVGPTLGAAFGLASQQREILRAALMMFLFGLGAALPLLGIAYLSRSAIFAHRSRLAKMGDRVKPIFGGVLVALGGIVLLGLDKIIESGVLNALPSWWLDLITRI